MNVRRLYYRFLYARLMRWMHHHDLHYAPLSYPDGDRMAWCQWCGLRYVLPPRAVPPIANAQETE